MLKYIIDKLEDVEDAFRSEYVSFDDAGTERYRLDVTGVQTHPDTVALKSALDRQKTRVRELNTTVSTLEGRLDDLPEDFDPDLYRRAVEQGVGGSGGKIPNEDEIRREASEAATRRAEAAAKKDLDKVVVERDRLKARVENDVKRAALDAALDEAKVTDPALRKGARALLLPSIVAHELDDDFEALAKDPELGDIPVADHVKAWAGTEEGKAYVGARESAGGGANGGSQGGTPPSNSDINPWKAATINVTKQADLRKNHPDLAKKLMKEAGLIV